MIRPALSFGALCAVMSLAVTGLAVVVGAGAHNARLFALYVLAVWPACGTVCFLAAASISRRVGHDVRL